MKMKTIKYAAIIAANRPDCSIVSDGRVYSLGYAVGIGVRNIY